jgi:hypothetical protein
MWPGVATRRVAFGRRLCAGTGICQLSTFTRSSLSSGRSALTTSVSVSRRRETQSPGVRRKALIGRRASSTGIHTKRKRQDRSVRRAEKVADGRG